MVLTRIGCLSVLALLLCLSAVVPQEKGKDEVTLKVVKYDGLTDLNVQALQQDRQGFLWVGTDNGLFRFDGRRFQRFGREDGLPSVRINALHETADGRLFVGTRAGLAVRLAEAFAPAEGVPAAPIFSYSDRS